MLSILKMSVIYRRADLGCCCTSHAVSSAICLRCMSFSAARTSDAVLRQPRTHMGQHWLTNRQAGRSGHIALADLTGPGRQRLGDRLK